MTAWRPFAYFRPQYHRLAHGLLFIGKPGAVCDESRIEKENINGQRRIEMKAIAILLILGAVGYFGYNHFLKPLTGEEQEVQVIQERFDSAFQEYLQAVRKA